MTRRVGDERESAMCVWTIHVLSKDEKVEGIDHWSALSLSGAVESSRPTGVLLVGDQL
jgi:hypothetical protein